MQLLFPPSLLGWESCLHPCLGTLTSQFLSFTFSMEYDSSLLEVNQQSSSCREQNISHQDMIDFKSDLFRVPGNFRKDHKDTQYWILCQLFSSPSANLYLLSSTPLTSCLSQIAQNLNFTKSPIFFYSGQFPMFHFKQNKNKTKQTNA